MTFSQPVQGVSLALRAFGRFGRTVTLTVTRTTDIPGPGNPAQVSVSGNDQTFFQQSASPLQIRSYQADIVAVTLSIDTAQGEYSQLQINNFRVESGTGPDPAKKVPVNGLREWLRADQIDNSYLLAPLSGMVFTTWADASGKGSSATADPASAPTVNYDGPNCTKVVSLRTPEQMSFNLPINGWTGMTVFLAAQSYTDPNQIVQNSLLFWRETDLWGATFLALFRRMRISASAQRRSITSPSTRGRSISEATSISRPQFIGTTPILCM